MSKTSMNGRSNNMVKQTFEPKFKGKTQTWMSMGKNAERERSRVRSLRQAFQALQSCLPSVPPDTKLSKLDILILATNYITLLMQTLGCFDHRHSSWPSYHHNQHFNHHQPQPVKVYRPIKKWPMRRRLYSMLGAGAASGLGGYQEEDFFEQNACMATSSYNNNN